MMGNLNPALDWYFYSDNISILAQKYGCRIRNVRAMIMEINRDQWKATIVGTDKNTITTSEENARKWVKENM
jgi:hypothetical protein